MVQARNKVFFNFWDLKIEPKRKRNTVTEQQIDLAAAQRFAAEVQAGMVRVNRPTVGAAFNAPFGGIKQSGTATHKEQLGPTVMDFYTVSRTVWLGS